jgi:hypothetical protein
VDGRVLIVKFHAMRDILRSTCVLPEIVQQRAGASIDSKGSPDDPQPVAVA